MSQPGAADLSVYDFHGGEWESYEALQEEFEWAIPETFNVAAYVCDRWAEEAPETVAVYGRDGGGEVEALTYGDLGRRASRFANFLAERGVGRGDRVAVNAPQKPEAVVAMVATWKLGGVVVPLSVLFGRDGLAYRLDDAGAKAFVVDEAAVGTYRAVADDVDLDAVVTVGVEADRTEELTFEAAIDGRPDGFETAATAAEDDAVIMYTSGTTGDPKGVRHAHRYLLANLSGYGLHVCNAAFEDDDLFWSPVEWSWGATLYVIVLPTLFYGRSILGSPREGFDPEEALGLIEAHDVTLFFAPATALRLTLQSGAVADYDVSSVRVLSSGGESLDRNVRARARDVFGHVAIHEAFGQTEALTLIVSCQRYFDPKPGTIGRSAPGQDVAVLDPETREPVETGEVGEFAVRYEGNPVCFKGYWNEPEKTAEKVVDGWLLTEDLGWVDEDGYFGYHSRKDDVIISSGYRISPAEIEESLAEHEAVANVAVIGVPDDQRGEVPKAFVVPAPGHEPDGAMKSALQDFVKGDLAKFEYPRLIEFRDSLPTTTTGKIQRHELEESG